MARATSERAACTARWVGRKAASTCQHAEHACLARACRVPDVPEEPVQKPLEGSW